MPVISVALGSVCPKGIVCGENGAADILLIFHIKKMSGNSMKERKRRILSTFLDDKKFISMLF